MDLEREVELLREKVRLLERLRELEGENIPAPIYPVPLYVPPYPLYPYTPWTDGDHTGKWIPDPTIVTCDGDNLTAVPGTITTGTATGWGSNNITWTQ